MLPSLLTFLRANKAHVTYILIILIIGVVTNYFFNQYSKERTRASGYEKAFTVSKKNVKVREVIKRIPILLSNGTVATEETRTIDTVDLSTAESGDERKSETETAKVTGRIPMFQAGLGLGIATQLDLGGFASLRLYGPYGIFVSGGSVGNFSGMGGYAGLTFSH